MQKNREGLEPYSVKHCTINRIAVVTTHRKKETLKILFFGLALVVAVVASTIHLPDSITAVGEATLSSAGQRTIGVLLFALVLWMTEAIPFHITGLLSLLLMTFLKVDSFSAIVQAGFGNHIVVFFIGVLVLSAFISRSGLGNRISVFLLAKTGNSTRTIILGFLVTGALLSMWVTDMAVAAILMPLGRAILREEEIEPLKSNFGKALMIACAWGPIIGGIGTPAGCGPNPLAIGFLKDMAGVDVNFVEWMTYGVPAALLLVIPAWGILMLFFPPEMKSLSKNKKELEAEFRELPPMSREEILTLVIFLLTVTLWLISPLLEDFLEISIPISLPVLLTSTLFFFPKISNIGWKSIEPEISWSGIILVVSGISLGMMLFRTGAAVWLSVSLLGRIVEVHPFVRILAIVLIVSLLKVGFSSNTVTATIIIPIIIALTKSLNLEPLSVTLPAALTSSLAFILVTSTPTNVIPYSAGYFSIADMAKAGLLMTLVSSLIVSATIFVLGKITNLY